MAAAAAGLVAVTGWVGTAQLRGGGPETFWEGLAPIELGPTGVMVYSNLAQIRPGGTGAGKLLPADVIVRGRVLSIQPGVGFGSGGDGATSPVVPFDSPDAIVRMGKLRVAVDSVVSGRLPAGVKQISVAWEVPRGADLAAINKKAAGAGVGLFYLSPGTQRLLRTGKPVIPRSYFDTVYLVVGSAAFIDDGSGRVTTPLLEDADRVRVAGASGTLEQITTRSAAGAP